MGAGKCRRAAARPMNDITMTTNQAQASEWSIVETSTVGAARRYTRLPVRRAPAVYLLLGTVGCLSVIIPDSRAGQPEAPPGAAARPPISFSGAQDLLMEGQYAEAKEAFARLAAQEGYKVRAGLSLAQCRLRVGEYAEAETELRQLDAGQDPEWRFTLALVLVRLGNYEEALNHAREAIRLKGDHAGARRLVGELLELLGRRDEAIAAYRWFDERLVALTELPRDAAWLTDAAVGFLRYSVLTQTNVTQRTQHVLTEMLQQAYGRIDRTYWPARLAAAELLREKYNNDEKDGSVSDYQAALRINPNLAEAFVGLGEVLLESWRFEEVEKHAEQALAVNPHEATAHHLLAKKCILERRYVAAGVHTADALAVQPNDVIALSLSAAASACRFDDAAVAALRTRVEAINPRPAVFHHLVGKALSGIRQYADSERAFLRAIELDPTDANARTELGMMYMQWGLEDKAREALDAAWTLDPFNQRTKFTLDLLDSLHKFATHETAHFIIRYDAARDPGLGEFIAGYLEEIYAPVTADYDTALAHKTIIEFFPTQRSFAVRITGQPWIHTVGACTGRVIALASPRKAPELSGTYNLARVLKHEFVHTVTLAATHNRIPHWFTEGLAVYQEDSPRPFEWAELLADGVRRDRLFTLESIDWGFMRPKRPTDRQMAYAQSEWMCEYIVERFGYDQINAMLERYRQGQTQPQVMREQLGLEMAVFDRDFGEWARHQASEWCFDLEKLEDPEALQALIETNEGEAALWGRLARAHYDADEFEKALMAAHRAVELDEAERHGLKTIACILGPTIAQEPSEARRKAFEDEALPVLRKLLEVEPGGWVAPKYLADIALRRREYDAAVESLTLLQERCPMDPTSWRGLAGIYLQRQEIDKALSQLLELARSEEHDADVPGQIASIYRRQGRLRDAIYWYRRALFIDPFSHDLHRALGQVCMQEGDAAGALRAYRMLTRVEPKNAANFADAATAALKLGDQEAARKFAAQAVELDPDSSAKAMLP